MIRALSILLLLCAGCATQRIDFTAEARRPAPVPLNAGEVLAALPKYEPGVEGEELSVERSFKATSYVLPAPGQSIALAWDCTNTAAQTFQFISTPSLDAPSWTVVTNVVGTNVVFLPKRYQQEFLTIGATWITGNPRVSNRWEGWK